MPARFRKGRSFLGRIAFKTQQVLACMAQICRGKRAMYSEEGRIRAEVDAFYKHPEPCTNCRLRRICDGLHGDYTQFFGDGEAKPVTDLPLVKDPCHYIDDQEKIVEPEDRDWAL